LIEDALSDAVTPRTGTMKKYAGLLVGAAVLAGLCYLSASGQMPDVKKLVQDNTDYLRKAGVKGMAAYVLVDIACIVACQPGSFLMELVAGYVYGLSVGSGLIVTAKLTAAGICFFLGKHMLADWVNSMLKTPLSKRSKPTRTPAVSCLCWVFGSLPFLRTSVATVHR